MKPTSPIVPGNQAEEVVYAKNSDEYVPLPVLRTANCVMSRWELTPEERAYLVTGGDLFICQLNGGGGLQPILPIAAPADEALSIMIELGAPL